MEQKILISGMPNNAGKTIHWVPSDTHGLYLRNLQNPETLEKIKQNGFYEVMIDYTFNSYGFRCPEFDPSVDSVLTLGDSFTFGIGLHQNQTWGHKLAEKLGMVHYNLAVGGSSADHAYRMASYWIPILKPKVVVFMVPVLHRTELIYYDSDNHLKVQQYSPAYIDTLEGKVFYEQWLSSDSNAVVNRTRNIDAISSVCRYNGCTYIVDTVEDAFLDAPVADQARDLLHAGPDHHTLVMEHIYASEYLDCYK